MVADEEAAPGAQLSVLGARPDLTMLALVPKSGPPRPGFARKSSAMAPDLSDRRRPTRALGSRASH
jgi:hypothetical protein